MRGAKRLLWLIHVAPHYLSGLWINQMDSCACRASHGLIGLGFASNWIIGDPALYV